MISEWTLTMNNIDKFYKVIYGLSYVTRYATIPRIKDESVAEHSFYVASLVIELRKYYNFDVGSATVMAVSHDWIEAWVDDITIKTKRDFPIIADAVNVAEREAANRELSDHVLPYWNEMQACETVEAKIVRLADILQCIQYSSHEIKLGNSGYMTEVLDSANSRLSVLIKELEHARTNAG